MSRFLRWTANTNRSCSAMRVAAILAALVLVPIAFPLSVRAAARADQDVDGDFICPPGTSNPDYCSDDDRGPLIYVRPSSVHMTKRGSIILRFTCIGRGTGNCFGTGRITLNVRTGPKHELHTRTFSQRRCAIRQKTATEIRFHLSGGGRRRVRKAGSLTVKLKLDARQADSRAARTSRSITIND